jgi:hypothetical protein
MRIIFSRKGVDSASGRCASPLIDGRPYSLPIPAKEDMPSPTRYGDLSALLQAAASDLTGGKLGGDEFCHLDPDIDPEALRNGRPPGWRGAFGQRSGPLSLLKNEGVTKGDLFLFWGVFREAKLQGTWRYVGPRRNLIFGWLQVESIEPVVTPETDLLARYPWLSQHPHVRPGWGTRNAVFLGRELLSFGDGSLPGYGVFRRPFMLTANGAKRASEWTVPAWLNPQLGGVERITFHSEKNWLSDGNLRAAYRGQEFVVDVGDRADARDWTIRLIGEHRH